MFFVKVIHSKICSSLTTVRNGKVKFNEEAEFQIKKSGNLRIQLCSVDGKKSVLSLNVSFAFRFKYDQRFLKYILFML